MTFTLDKAKKLVLHYQFLLGRFIDNEQQFKITDIVIAPVDPNQYSKFSVAYAVNKNNDSALLHSGFNKDNIRVLLLHHNFTVLLHYDLDGYLTKHNLEKIYTAPNF